LNVTPNTIDSDLAGRICVWLSVRAGVVEDVDIESTRPKGVAKVFVGHAPDEVVSLLGRVFSLCATAQSVAGLEAVEAARGLSVSAQQHVARHMLREAEMLSQTVLRVSMDWTRLLSLPPVPAVARTVLSAEAGLKADLFSGRDWKVPGGIPVTPDIAAARARLNDLQDVLGTALHENGLAQNLLSALDAHDLNGFGALAKGARPETGALSRQWQDSGVVTARKVYGAGLRARLMARFADMRDLSRFLAEAVNTLTPCAVPQQASRQDGDGTATVETARGALTHRVVVKDGKIAAYDIDAPTDVNFLNGSVVARGLIGAARDRRALDVAAQLHVLAVDPCVECTVEIKDA